MAKTWLITGCSRGLGRGVAEAVLERGDNLVATARKPEQLAALVETYGTRCRAVALDVTDVAAARAGVNAAVEAFGRLDVVVNNAGYGLLGATEEISDAQMRAQVETNLFGVFHVTRAALGVFRAQRSGHVIQISSIGGRSGNAGLSIYQATKFAVGGFSEALAKEVAHLGIKVTVVEPGGFRTDWGGSSMVFAESLPEYAETVGQLRQQLAAYAPYAPGDPVRGGKVIAELPDLAEPPLHLVLGNDALSMVRQVVQAQLAELDQWEALSRATDFPDTKPMDPALMRLVTR
ncbi:oxidoreductase [Chondromyces apiculatus]|uniref:Dehydrogenase n=1 Tax=Chondromyces apiculatus DSM 436 TaxID=1192034 RepID=A0A017TE31_9BACT|nr:oxidoreductase [Chondromyces apiculatus]EYF06881.1 Dehydrogenase [Chondromyces apiculatus DSM 436]